VTLRHVFGKNFLNPILILMLDLSLTVPRRCYICHPYFCVWLVPYTLCMCS